jgi:hypothetical protein
MGSEEEIDSRWTRVAKKEDSKGPPKSAQRKEATAVISIRVPWSMGIEIADL